MNEVLFELSDSLQAILQDNLVSLILQGSFSVGDFDRDSDVDFTVVMKNELSDLEFAALQQMHFRIFEMESQWARHLEGSYFSEASLLRKPIENEPVWYLDNTHKTLERSKHDDTPVVRWVMREHGIPLFGAHPKLLINLIAPEELKEEVAAEMQSWKERIFLNPVEMDNRWYQPFAVISYCRMLQTLETGRIESKLSGVKWGIENLDKRWNGLIERAWRERPDVPLKVTLKADFDDFEETFQFILYALEKIK